MPGTRAQLGSSGPVITRIGLGTWAIGGPYEFGWGPTDDEESIGTIHYAVEQGLNWIDTAPVYGRGHSEELIGLALRSLDPGVEVYVFTKCGRNFYDTDQISSDLRPATIRRECDESLRRLGVERIDLLQFHWPDPDTGARLEDSWAALGELVDEGKVRWAGVSNFPPRLLDVCESIRHVDSVQPPLNLLNRGARDDVIPWCREHGAGVIAYAPLANGLLTEKYRNQPMRQLTPDDWRRRSPQFQEPALSRNLRIATALGDIAHRIGVNLPVLAIAWVLAIPGVTGAIVGARRPDQVRNWLDAMDRSLSPGTLAEIDSVLSA
jgi:aryl-alcohol dehydrogenase-like predicted oxidoreductase